MREVVGRGPRYWFSPCGRYFIDLGDVSHTSYHSKNEYPWNFYFKNTDSINFSERYGIEIMNALKLYCGAP